MCVVGCEGGTVGGAESVIVGGVGCEGGTVGGAEGGAESVIVRVGL